MSWESYVEHLMVDLPHGGKLTSAAIVGQDGGVWAQSPAFPAVSTDQVRVVTLEMRSGGRGVPAQLLGAGRGAFLRAAPTRSQPPAPGRMQGVLERVGDAAGVGTSCQAVHAATEGPGRGTAARGSACARVQLARRCSALAGCQ